MTDKNLTGQSETVLTAQSHLPRFKARKVILKEQLTLHSMMIPGVVLAVIFYIVPLVGLLMAFEKYDASRGIFGSQWVGGYQFRALFRRPDFLRATANTVIIAAWKIVFITVLSVGMALLINEIRQMWLKKTVQTVVFLPYFLSWALLGGIMTDMFSYSGSFNHFLSVFGISPEYWITSNKYFRAIVISTDVWKQLGYQVVVFLAAVVNIDPTLYEAARVDGANNRQLCRHITLPGIMSMIVLMSILNIGNIMNAGFEQILVMYSPSVYDTGDILDTMVYRIGLQQAGNSNQYSVATAIGLFKAVISCILFSFSYWLAYRLKGYKIF